VPWKKNHLDNKVKEFIYIAADASATHLYTPGIQQHFEAAIKHGATRDELMEVIELTSTLGIHASNPGVPILLEVLEEEGMRQGPAPLDAKREALKASFVKNRGYWYPSWDGLFELDPELFEAYLDFSSVPWRTGVLELKIKELIYCIRCRRDSSVSARSQAAHVQRVALWRNRRGDHGSAGDRERDRHSCSDSGCAHARKSARASAAARLTEPLFTRSTERSNTAAQYAK
jgi:Carboxymuconolactone decarboxylase family